MLGFPVMSDPAVYAHQNGVHYVAWVDGALYRWPAERNGWSRRERADQRELTASEALSPSLARLALNLSGVPRGDPPT
jgi:hypothetical protein